MAIKRRGLRHVPALLQIATPLNTCEDAWQFPVEYRDGLEDEYSALGLPGENRINFLIRLTRTEYHSLKARRLNWHDDPEVRANLNELCRLEHAAVDDLAMLREQDRHMRLYGHIVVPVIRWLIEDDHPQLLAAQKDPKILRGF